MGEAVGEGPDAAGAEEILRSATQSIRTVSDLLARWSELPDDLVLSRTREDGRVERAARELAEALREHASRVDRLLALSSDDARIGSASAGRLRREHEVFATSVSELKGLIAVVHREGHDGNRQALGQYWRLLWEALRIHVEDEERGLGLRLGDPRGNATVP